MRQKYGYKDGGGGGERIARHVRGGTAMRMGAKWLITMSKLPHIIIQAVAGQLGGADPSGNRAGGEKTLLRDLVTEKVDKLIGLSCMVKTSSKNDPKKVTNDLKRTQ